MIIEPPFTNGQKSLNITVPWTWNLKTHSKCSHLVSVIPNWVMTAQALLWTSTSSSALRAGWHPETRLGNERQLLGTKAFPTSQAPVFAYLSLLFLFIAKESRRCKNRRSLEWNWIQPPNTTSLELVVSLAHRWGLSSYLICVIGLIQLMKLIHIASYFTLLNIALQPNYFMLTYLYMWAFCVYVLLFNNNFS